jgi:N-methylhydantoinase A/oxoprolinase/acetone carboxylase beta subunit
MAYRVGVDIGGTFADFCAFNEATGRRSAPLPVAMQWRRTTMTEREGPGEAIRRLFDKLDEI